MERQRITQIHEKALKQTIDIHVQENTIENEKNKQQISSSLRNKSRNFKKMSSKELFNEFDITLGSSVSSISKIKFEDKTTGELLKEFELVRNQCNTFVSSKGNKVYTTKIFII